MELEKNGRGEAKDIANTLTENDLNTILATADFFGASEAELTQIYFDLWIARYRVFDWLAMGVQGRFLCENAVKVFVHSFIKANGVPSKFVEDLQVTDYEVVKDWEKVELPAERW